MAAPSAGSKAEATQSVVNEAAPSFDLFLIHTAADAVATAKLAEALERQGRVPWLAGEQGLGPRRWKPDALERLGQVSACALVIGSAGLPGEWGRREVEEAALRKQTDPAFRFILIYLPDAAPVPAEALPLAPDAVISLRSPSDSSGIDEVVAAVAEASVPEEETLVPSSSVEEALRFPDQVSGFQIVRRLLEFHSEYGGGLLNSRDVGDGPSDAPRRTVDGWLAAVRGLYEPARVPVLHGRLLIEGLARLDRQLADQLGKANFLPTLRREIRPPVGELLRRKRDAVETLADQPSDVDELGRAVIAKVLATRMRRVRLRELERNEYARADRRRGGPFLLHLYGRWGSGKTSLLNFLRQALESGVWEGPNEPDRRTYLQAARDAYRRWRTNADRRLDEVGGDPLGRWIVIDFNGWQHQRIVPPWWWLMAAVSREGSRTLRRLDRPRWIRLKVWDYGWRLKGAVPGVFMIGAGLAIGWFIWKYGPEKGGSDWGAAFKGMAAVAQSFAVIIALFVTVWGGVKAMSRWLLVSSPRTASQVLRHGRDPLDALSVRYGKLVRRMHYPVAIFIDDLDRCKSAYVVELLEGVQTLFKDVPVTYVVAADRDWICQSFALEYEGYCSAAGQPGRPLGHLFLEKTFQISAPVPALSDDIRSAYLERLLSGATTSDGTASLDAARSAAQKRFQTLARRDEIDTVLEQTVGSPLERQAAAEAAVLRLAEPELERETEHMLQAFAPLLEPNPRSMKRLVNAYGIASAVEILRSASDGIGARAHHSDQLVLWTILDLRWPLLADYLAGNPAAAKQMLDGNPPEDDEPSWLQTLWKSQEVRAVLSGDAPGVHASLADTEILAGFAGRARAGAEDVTPEHGFPSTKPE